MGNPFEEDRQDPVILDTKDIADPAAVETMMNAKRIGQEQCEAFTRECLLDRTKSVDDPIPRNKLKLFSTSTSRKQSTGQQTLASVKNDRELFARTLAARRGMETLRSYFVMRIRHVLHRTMVETSSLVPRMISSQVWKKSPTPRQRLRSLPVCIVLDGAASIQMLKPAASKTFEEYAHHIPYVSTKLQTVSRLDLVWDTYLADSLKGSTRARCGQGVQRCVQPYQETGRAFYE